MDRFLTVLFIDSQLATSLVQITGNYSHEEHVCDWNCEIPTPIAILVFLSIKGYRGILGLSCLNTTGLLFPTNLGLCWHSLLTNMDKEETYKHCSFCFLESDRLMKRIIITCAIWFPLILLIVVWFRSRHNFLELCPVYGDLLCKGLKCY